MLFFSNCEVIFICVNCESVHAEVKGSLTSFPKYKSHLKHKGTILQEYTWRLYENETMFTSKKKNLPKFSFRKEYVANVKRKCK